MVHEYALEQRPELTVGYEGCARYSAGSVLALRKGYAVRRIRTRGGPAVNKRPLQQRCGGRFIVFQMNFFRKNVEKRITNDKHQIKGDKQPWVFMRNWLHVD